MLADLKKLVDGFVRDESERLTRADKEGAITLAVARYGKDRPRRKVEDVVSAGGDTLPLPSAWESESQLLTVEFPIGETPPTLLPCSIYSAPSGDVLRLGDGLAAGAEARLTFTVRHVVSDVLDTVPDGHREAVAAYAAALLLEQLAAGAINDGDTTLQADTTDRRTKAQEYASRARALKTRYGEAMGVGEAGGASGQAASGTMLAWPGRSRVTRGIRSNV
jgi:hypothetical protein